MNAVQGGGLTKQFVQFRSQCWTAEVGCGDGAVLVHEEGVGDAAHSIGRAASFCQPFKSHVIGPIQSIHGDGGLPTVGILINDTERPQSLHR